MIRKRTALFCCLAAAGALALRGALLLSAQPAAARAAEPPKATANLAAPVAAVAPAAAAPATAPAAVPAPLAVAASTPTATISSIYTVEKLRDPFSKGGGASAAAKLFTADDFNIHNLSLRGIMKDASSDYALLSDPEFGVSFILRKGKLYDSKNKLVPGVSGRIDVKRKTVDLATLDKDVQVFRLGEEEEKK